jgi:ABC-type nitrate/sulfonate/bicarbonate transport system ATPase subunit
MLAIKLNNLKVAYSSKKSNQVLSIQNIEIEEGKVVGIFGPNHVGKSTLLKVIGQLHADLHISKQSEILYFEKAFDIKKRQPLILHVPQDYNSSILPWHSIDTNLKIFLKALNVSDKQIKIKINSFCKPFSEFTNPKEMFHYFGFSQNGSDNTISQLSGGQKQIISVLRALIPSPDIITMDEPFSAIDMYRGQSFRTQVFKFTRSNNITTLIISHELEDLLSFSDEIIFFNSDNEGNGNVFKGIERIEGGGNLPALGIQKQAMEFKKKYEIK